MLPALILGLFSSKKRKLVADEQYEDFYDPGIETPKLFPPKKTYGREHNERKDNREFTKMARACIPEDLMSNALSSSPTSRAN